MEPGNIWSGSKTLAVLTNPTELALRKGNLKNHYPILWKGVRYADVEAAYQARKLIEASDLDERVLLMARMIWVKLNTYPQIRQFIADNGGVEWLEKCSHHVNGGWWEGAWGGYGDGRISPFIRALIRAYEG